MIENDSTETFVSIDPPTKNEKRHHNNVLPFKNLNVLFVICQTLMIRVKKTIDLKTISNRETINLINQNQSHLNKSLKRDLLDEWGKITEDPRKDKNTPNGVFFYIVTLCDTNSLYRTIVGGMLYRVATCIVLANNGGSMITHRKGRSCDPCTFSTSYTGVTHGYCFLDSSRRSKLF